MADTTLRDRAAGAIMGAFIESYGFSVPYVFVLDGSAGDSMLTRAELRRVNDRFPDKKIIMNTHTWVDDKAHVESIKDLVDGICIEYFPHNAPFNIALHVAPFARWAYKNKKWVCSLLNRPHNVVWGHGNPKISGCRDRLPTNVPRI